MRGRGSSRGPRAGPGIQFILILVTAAVTGCGAGWRRLDDLRPRALPLRKQVQVWQGGDATLLHGVVLTPDTVRGVPFTQTPACDSCRVRLPLAGIDSLRIGNKERGFFRTVGLVLIGLAITYAFSGIGGA